MNVLKNLKLLSITSVACLAMVSTGALASQKAQGTFLTTNKTTFNAYNTGINNIRLQALRETAMTLGAQSGLAWKAKNINVTLQNQSDRLNRIFNFNGLLMKNNLLPPVIVEASDEVNLADNDTMRISDKIYKIIKPARLVTVAPSWRVYLMLDYQTPETPDRTLLPRTKMEAQVWNAYIRQGWQQGVDQANAIFDANLNRLKRDYKGMILYKQLVLKSMVSTPHVSKADLGITGDAKEMRINDQIIRITSHSALQTDSSKWNPILSN